MTTPQTTLCQYFDEHYYKIVMPEKTYYIPSVTTKNGVLDKEDLARWRGDIGNREADMRVYEASQKGKRIHWSYETFLKGGAVIYDPWQSPLYTDQQIQAVREQYGNVAILRTQEEMLHIYRLQEQFKILKPEVLDVERIVYDLENLDAGTIDSVFKIKAGTYPIAGREPLTLDAGIYINDLKTGKHVDDNVWLQLAPYAYMYEKLTGLKVQGALVTHTSANIKSGIKGLKTLFRPREILLGKDYQDYRHAAALWERNHNMPIPEELFFPSLIAIGA